MYIHVVNSIHGLFVCSRGQSQGNLCHLLIHVHVLDFYCLCWQIISDSLKRQGYMHTHTHTHAHTHAHTHTCTHTQTHLLIWQNSDEFTVALCFPGGHGMVHRSEGTAIYLQVILAIHGLELEEGGGSWKGREGGKLTTISS